MSGPNSTANSTNFFLVLPSNTQDYSSNTLSRFRVRLPKPIQFRGGNWVCALHSLQYPCSWASTLGTFEPQWIDVHLEADGDRKTFRINVPAGSFQTNEDLLISLRQTVITEAKRLDKTINGRLARKRRYVSASHPLPKPAKKQKKAPNDQEGEEEEGDMVSDLFGHLPKEGEKNLAEEVTDELLGSPPRATSREEDHADSIIEQPKSKPAEITSPEEKETEKSATPTTIVDLPPPPPSIARALPNLKTRTPSPPKKKASFDLPRTDQEISADEGTRKKLDENAVDFPKYPIVPIKTAVRSPTRAVSHEGWTLPQVPVYATDPVDDAADDDDQGNLEDGIAGFFGKIAKMWEKNRAEEFADTFTGSNGAGPLERILHTISFEWLRQRDRLMVLLMHPSISHISMSYQLAHVTGFGNTADRITNEQEARYGIDLQGDFSSFAVSARGLTEEIIVGNRTSSLLRIMGIDSKKHPAGRCVERIFDSPLFLPVVPQEISEVEIELHTLNGQYVPFNFGSVLVTLLFKKLIQL